MLGNMEKAPVQTDAPIVSKDDVSHIPSQQDDDPKPDYSSKATTKTKFTDYLRIFTYSTWSDRIILVGRIFHGLCLVPCVPRLGYALYTSRLRISCRGTLF